MSHLLNCMGEMLIDFLPIEEHNATVGFHMHAGGSPMNVAVGLARLGQPTAFTGKISTDFFGRYLRNHIERENIDIRFLIDSIALSTLAFVASEGGEPAYSFYGEGAADTLLTPDELPASFFTDTSILHVGSISLLRGSTPEAILSAVERLKGHALISLDPNIRPGLVRDEAGYRAVLDQCFTLADVVKISQVDLEWFAPGQSLEETAAHILSRGPGLVVVTQGGQGALAVRMAMRAALQDAEDTGVAEGVVYLHVPAFEVDVVDTVGAGDAFSAGLLAGLAERDMTSRASLAHLSSEDLEAVLRFAGATSALTCTRAGANPPTRPEVEQFLYGS